MHTHLHARADADARARAQAHTHTCTHAGIHCTVHPGSQNMYACTQTYIMRAPSRIRTWARMMANYTYMHACTNTQTQARTKTQTQTQPQLQSHPINLRRAMAELESDRSRMEKELTYGEEAHACSRSPTASRRPHIPLEIRALQVVERIRNC